MHLPVHRGLHGVLRGCCREHVRDGGGSKSERAEYDPHLRGNGRYFLSKTKRWIDGGEGVGTSAHAFMASASMVSSPAPAPTSWRGTGPGVGCVGGVAGGSSSASVR